jgi:hypothetical protein
MGLTSNRLLASAGSVMLGLGLAAWRARPPGAVPPTGFLVVNGAMLLAGTLLVGAATLRSRAKAWLPPASPEWTQVAPPLARYPILGVAIGTGLAALGPHLSLVFFGGVLAAWCGWALMPATPRRRTALGPAITLLLLPVYWLLTRVAGPVGLAMRSLPDAPLSPAAERLFSASLLVVAGAMSLLVGAPAAPAAAVLLTRVGMGSLPSGLEYWRTIAYPVLVIALWVAAFRRRPDLVAVAGTLMGLLSLDRDGIAGGCILLVAAVLIDMRRRGALDGGWVRVLLAFLLASGGIEALTGALRVEVFYSVLAALGVGVALATASPMSRGYIWRDER